MFLCCCPWKKSENRQMKQSLIDNDGTIVNLQPQQQINSISKNSPQSPKMMQQVQKLEKLDIDDTRSEPYDSIDKDSKSLQERINKTETKPKFQNSGVPPNFGKPQQFRPFSPRERHQSVGAPKKSHLWKQQLKSDLIYIEQSISNYIYMSYRLNKNQQMKDSLNGLDYFLSKSQDKFHVIIGKQSMFNTKISTLNKYNYNLINAILICQGRSTDQSLGLVEAILMEDLRSIRWNGINSIVVMADSLNTFAEVKQYLTSVFKDLTWEQLKKATFLFPPFLTLQEISQLLFPHFKQYVTRSTLEKVSLDLVFDMELIEGTNLECCIIIKNRAYEAKQGNSVYDHLKLSIVFFAKELSELTQRIYTDFYLQSKDKSLKEYFEMKEFYRKTPQQFRQRIKKMKELDPKIFLDLQNSAPLKQFPLEDPGYYYVIPSKVRQEIGRIYNIPELQKKQVDTPIKKEWDDDATADDFKTIKTSKLDQVAKDELDKIDLDMGLGSDSDSDIDSDKSQEVQDKEIEMKVEVEELINVRKLSQYDE